MKNDDLKYKVTRFARDNNNIPLGSPRDYNEPWMDRNIMKIWKKKNHAWNRLGERNLKDFLCLDNPHVKGL